MILEKNQNLKIMNFSSLNFNDKNNNYNIFFKIIKFTV
jgi:hypothetical protein